MEGGGGYVNFCHTTVRQPYSGSGRGGGRMCKLLSYNCKAALQWKGGGGGCVNFCHTTVRQPYSGRGGGVCKLLSYNCKAACFAWPQSVRCKASLTRRLYLYHHQTER